MAGNPQDPTLLEHSPHVPGVDELVGPGDQLHLTFSLVRHRDLSRRSRDVVYQLFVVRYRPDGGVLHSYNESGPLPLLAESLYRMLDLAWGFTKLLNQPNN